MSEAGDRSRARRCLRRWRRLGRGVRHLRRIVGREFLSFRNQARIDSGDGRPVCVAGDACANIARRYFLTAEKFNAAEAFRIGLVHELALPEELDGKVNEILGALMLTSQNAVAEAKRLVRDLTARPIDDALVADTARRIADIRTSADGREGVRSFLEKRKPQWVLDYEAMTAAEDESVRE